MSTLSKPVMQNLAELCQFRSTDELPIEEALEGLRVLPLNWNRISLLNVLDASMSGVEAFVYEFGDNLAVVMQAGADDVDKVVFKREKFAELIDLDVSVNSEFLTMWRSLNGDLNKLIWEWTVNNPGAMVYIVGHGVGGALACLQSLFTQSTLELGDLLTFVSFGSPRVGSRSFIDNFNAAISNAFRVINDVDPVPRMGHNGFSRLHHCGQVQHLRDDGALHLSYYSMWRTMWGALEFDRHQIDAYISSINNWNRAIVV